MAIAARIRNPNIEKTSWFLRQSQLLSASFEQSWVSSNASHKELFTRRIPKTNTTSGSFPRLRHYGKMIAVKANWTRMGKVRAVLTRPVVCGMLKNMRASQR